MKALLSRTGFRDLLVGQGVSALGDWMGTFAFIALVARHRLVHRSGGDPRPAAPSRRARGPFTARLVHRWDRRRTMLAMDAARAAMIAVIPFVTAIWWIYLWAFLIELASLAFLPARDASIPDLAGDDDLRSPTASSWDPRTEPSRSGRPSSPGWPRSRSPTSAARRTTTPSCGGSTPPYLSRSPTSAA